jgi:ligand-binding sensor domain-containing protein/signal transduction histidine kinase/DNA-binding response OmpR family regulator
MRPVSPVLLAILLLLSVWHACAMNPDNIRFAQKTVADGLAHNHVRDIAKDRTGYMWFATRGGLSRYDGHELVNYRHSDADAASLPHNYVNRLMVDSSGRLWVATDNGVARYNVDQDNFHCYKRAEENPIRSKIIFQSSRGDIFASFGREIMIFDEARDSFVRPPSPIRFQGDPYDVAEDNHRQLWIATNAGLQCIDLARMEFTDPLPLNDPHSALLRDTHIISLLRDSNGHICLGTHDDGLFIFNPNKATFTHLDQSGGLSNNTIRDITEYQSGRLLLGTEFGIDIVNRHNGHVHVHHLRHDLECRCGLSDNAIYSLYIDGEQNLWVGTFFGGLNVCMREYGNFAFYPSGFSDSHLSGGAVREIVGSGNVKGDDNDGEGNGSIWIATEDGGLNRFDPATGTFRHHTSSSAVAPVSYRNVHSLAHDSRGNLWIGSFTGGVNRLDIARHTMQYYNSANCGAPIDNTFTLLEDRNGETVWFGGTNGLSRYDHSTEQFTPIGHPLLKRFIYHMIQDRDGVLWLAMRERGVVTFDPATCTAGEIKLSADFRGVITTLFEDSGGDLWIGSSDRGVLHYDLKTGEMVRYSKADGLPSNAVMSVMEDSRGTMWIGTEGGLCRFDPLTEILTNYTTADGLPSNQFCYSSAYEAPGGELYFGINGGMIAFHPDSLRVAPELHPIVVTALYINGRFVRENIANRPSIRLNHKQAELFGLSFSAFDFSRSDATYQMSLDGSEWQDVGPQRHVTFSNLTSGSHTIGFRTDDTAAGITTIRIDVSPSFWWSWMGWLIYAVVAAGLTLVAFHVTRMKLIYSARLELERVESENAREMNRRKIHFFTNVSHELKTPLTLILSPLEKLRADNLLPVRVRGQLDVVARNARRMLRMTDELMTFSKLEMGQARITVQRGAVLPFVGEMCEIFRLVAHNRDLDLRVDIDRNDETMVWFSPGDVEKIINNIMSNAFKWGGQRIEVSARLERREARLFLRLEVRDTGIGIPVEAIRRIFDNYYQVNPADKNSGSGVGLAFTKALVNLHRGTIEVKSEHGHGSTFTVFLDVSEDSFGESERSAVTMDADSLSSWHYTIAVDDNPESIGSPNSPDSPETSMAGSIADGASGSKGNQARRTLLVVEDNRELNGFVCDIFRDRFAVLAAFDGEEGLEMILEHEPDIVITDVMMPRMDGLALTEKIKSNLSTSHITVVMLTAKTSLDETIEGLEYGADAYIQKPFDVRSLELQVSNIMTTRANNIRKFRNSPTVEVSNITYNRRDEKFMSDVVAVIRANIDNESLSVDLIAEHTGVSRSMLYMKLKKLADVSANELIRNIRMTEARALLGVGYNVSEVSYAVGISNPNYFTKCFKKHFGITPTYYVKGSVA